MFDITLKAEPVFTVVFDIPLSTFVVSIVKFTAPAPDNENGAKALPTGFFMYWSSFSKRFPNTSLLSFFALSTPLSIFDISLFFWTTPPEKAAATAKFKVCEYVFALIAVFRADVIVEFSTNALIFLSIDV